MLPWREQAKAKIRFQIRYELMMVASIVLVLIAGVQHYFGYLETTRQAQVARLQNQVQAQNARVTAYHQKYAQHAISVALPELQQMQFTEWQRIAECLGVLETVKGRDIALHTIRYQWPFVRVLGSAAAELRIFDFVERVQQKLPMATVKVEQLKSTGRKTQRDPFEFSMEIKQKYPSWLKSEHIFKPSSQDSNPLNEEPV